MAKVQADPYVLAFLDFKPIVSKLKQLAQVICVDTPSELIGTCSVIHMIGNVLPVDRFAITDNCFQVFSHYLINTEAFIAFSKNVKKTKTTATVEPSKDDSPILVYHNLDKVPDMADFHIKSVNNRTVITAEYHLFCKDLNISKLAMDAALNMDKFPWEALSEHEMQELIDGNSVELVTENGPLMVSKALFGQVKKTKRIAYLVLDEDSDTQLVMFCQWEDGCRIFTMARFLITEF